MHTNAEAKIYLSTYLYFAQTFLFKSRKILQFAQTKIGISNLIFSTTPSHAIANNNRIPTCENAIAYRS